MKVAEQIIKHNKEYKIKTAKLFVPSLNCNLIGSPSKQLYVISVSYFNLQNAFSPYYFLDIGQSCPSDCSQVSL